jgi:hypothetical protein
MKKVLAAIFAIVLVIVAAGGYMGVIPGLASVFGADKPRDFGIRYTAEDSAAAQRKSGVKLAALPEGTAAGESFRLSGKRDADITMNQTELTAHVNNRPWRYYPFENVQIRINPDGSAEASGVLNADRVLSYAAALGFRTDDVKKAMADYHIPVVTMPFYVKARGGVTDNRVSLSIASATAGRLPIPGSVLSGNTGRIAGVLEGVIDHLPGVSVSSLTFTDGKMHFAGTLPETESVVMK